MANNTNPQHRPRGLYIKFAISHLQYSHVLSVTHVKYISKSIDNNKSKSINKIHSQYIVGLYKVKNVFAI